MLEMDSFQSYHVYNSLSKNWTLRSSFSVINWFSSGFPASTVSTGRKNGKPQEIQLLLCRMCRQSSWSFNYRENAAQRTVYRCRRCFRKAPPSILFCKHNSCLFLFRRRRRQWGKAENTLKRIKSVKKGVFMDNQCVKMDYNTSRLPFAPWKEEWQAKRCHRKKEKAVKNICRSY